MSVQCSTGQAESALSVKLATVMLPLHLTFNLPFLLNPPRFLSEVGFYQWYNALLHQFWKNTLMEYIGDSLGFDQEIILEKSLDRDLLFNDRFLSWGACQTLHGSACDLTLNSVLSTHHLSFPKDWISWITKRAGLSPSFERGTHRVHEAHAYFSCY